MGKMRAINTDFWTDIWVVDTLNPLDCHLFMYLLTNPQTNLIGAYELSLRIMSFQVGIEKDELTRMLKRLEPKVKYIDGWVILVNGLKYQNYKNSNLNVGILREAKTVPSHILQHIKWPSDFGQTRPEGSKQTQIFDDPTMTHTSTKLNLTKLNPTVTAVEQTEPVDNFDNGTTETAGLKKEVGGSKYFEIDLLYTDLSDLVNDRLKAWYCSQFFKLGRERVMVLASQARADGTNPQKLFSHLLKKEAEVRK